MSGLIVVLVVLAAASVVGLVMRRRQGRFRAQSSTSAVSRTQAADSSWPAAAGGVVTAAELGAPLGEQLPCRPAVSAELGGKLHQSRPLAEVAGARDGVAFVEVDAARRLDLTRRLNVRTTPTVLLLAADGSIAQRASGKPSRSDVLAAVGSVLGEGVPS